MFKYFLLLSVPVLISTTLFGQQSDSEKRKEATDIARLTPLMKAAELTSQGKFSDAIVYFDRYLADIKTDPQEKASYLNCLEMEAYCYQKIGNYRKAEQLLKNALKENEQTNSTNNPDQMQRMLMKLATLYEELGDTDKEESILERIIVQEYGEKTAADEKDVFFSYYRQQYKQSLTSYKNKFNNASQRFRQSSGNSTRTGTHPADSTRLKLNDSLAIEKTINEAWKNYQHTVNMQGGDSGKNSGVFCVD